MNPTAFAKVHHRYGHVFLRIVRVTAAGRTATLIRLQPAQAEKLGQDIARCGRRAQPKLRLKG